MRQVSVTATVAAVDRAPLIPQHGALRDRVVMACVRIGVRASLLVSPRPAALLLRRVFASGGARTARGLARHAPAGVSEILDQRYGDGPDELLDVFRPARSTEALPTIVWIHGGGWVGGAKEEQASYYKLIASSGYAVVGLRYSLAPEHCYPLPARQIMRALGYLQANGERLGLDPARIVVAGDSAGAQLAAQTAALVTTPGYADAVGVAPAITGEHLRGVVLACGPYDLALLGDGAGTSLGRRVAAAVLWAYSGHRHFLREPGFASASVADHLTPAFPPALVTVGNADPLKPHSELLVERLMTNGVRADTVFFPADHQPPLGHEYQFDLDTLAGRLFLERMLAFLAQHLGAEGYPQTGDG
jgi:acetyl esterase